MKEKKKEIDSKHIISKQDLNNEDELKDVLTDCTFVKLIKGNGLLLCDTLTNSELATVFLMSDFISYDDCKLRMGGHKNGNILSCRELSKQIDKKYNTLRKIVRTLNIKKAIRINKDKSITVNPFIMCRGSQVKKEVVDYFSDSVWANSQNIGLASNSIYDHLRKIIDDWKTSSMNFCNYKCVITSGKFDHIHHLIGFKYIVDKVLNEMNLDPLDYNNYSQAQIIDIQNRVIELHNIYGFGLCLNDKVHILFHQIFGYKDFNYNDFLNFINNIQNGKYNGWFKENNLKIDVNDQIVEYVKHINNVNSILKI